MKNTTKPMENHMKNNITTLSESDLYEIIQRQHMETIERQAREIVHLKDRLKTTTERLNAFKKIYEDRLKAIEEEWDAIEWMGH